MRVLITGAEGMLAKSLIKLLNDAHEVTGADKGALNITDKSGIESALSSMRPEVVINSAAFTKVDDCEEKKELAYAVNAEGPKNLAAACRDRGVKLIHISTDYVFDGEKREPYLEGDRVNPINEYGRTKLKGEEYIKELLNDHLIIRTQ
jgi:dTDP-4-dehydrorhamnose reductase